MSRNNCVKTGARVLLQPYGCVVAADLYDQGTVYVVRFNNRSQNYECGFEGASHIANLETLNVWYHEEAGVAVVPKDALLFLNKHEKASIRKLTIRNIPL